MARRGELSRDLVIDAALSRLDRFGSDSLSMRELAADLEVSPMALYRHVHNKDELLDLVADKVISRFVPEPADVAWPEQAARICRRMRQELLAHPGVADRVWQRPIASSATSVQVNGAIVSMLVGSGLPRDVVPRAYWMLAIYTNGSVRFEIERGRARGSRARTDGAARQQKLAALLDASDVDIVDAEALTSVLSVDFGDEQFEFGLAATIHGIEAMLLGEREA